MANENDAGAESAHVDVTSMLEGIVKFSGDDPTYSSAKWAQDIEDNAEIFQWTATQKLIIARRSLRGTAALWLQTEKIFKTYDDLKTALQKEFPDFVNTKEMHEIMSKRKKKKEESFYQYMLSMKELGKRARFPDYVSIQYIIDGIVDYEPNKAMLYGVVNFSTLKERLVQYEKMKANMTTKKEERPVLKTEKFTKKSHSFGRRHCYKCGDEDHVAATCTKGIKCFRCNEYGHIGQQCTKTSGSGKSSMAAAGSSSSTPAAKKPPYSGITEIKMATVENVSGDSDGLTLTASSVSSEQVMQSMRIDRSSSSSNNKPTKDVIICEKTANSLVDSGSDINLMSVDFYDAIGLTKSDDNIVFSGLGLVKVRSLGKLTTSITIDKTMYNDVLFHIVPKNCMPYDVIIGQEFLKDVVMIMNGGDITLLELGWMNRVNCVTMDGDFFLGHIKDDQVKMEVLKCANTYEPNQTKEAPIQLKIVLKDDVPVSQRPRRISLKEQQIVEQQIEEWLATGIIRVSYSDYSSPLVLVRKKDNSVRVCVDYRLLNRKLVKDEFPLPVIEDLIDKLRNALVFSVLDLKNGFFHLKVSEESIRYTSFVTHNGQWEFLKAPFGLANCPKTFMRFVSIIFRELIAEGIMTIFIDDILIPAEDEQQAVE